MNIEMLQRCLSKGSWGKEDYRVLKPILQADAGEWQKQFSPLKKEEYMGNPIQVIDFSWWINIWWLHFRCKDETTHHNGLF